MVSSIFAAFKIIDIEIALAINHVREVINYPDKINQMPLSPIFLIGVFNLRGNVIPLIDLKKLLCLPTKNDNNDKNQKVVITEIDGAEIGILVDGTTEILRISENNLNLIDFNNQLSDKVIAGIIKLEDGDRMIQVLNPNALFKIKNIPQIIAKQKKHHQNNLQNHKLEKCITFLIGNLQLGLEISSVFEIIKIPDIQNSPIDNEICLGVINLRGISVPIINSHKIFQEEKNQTDNEPRRILIMKNNQSLMGFVVDQVLNISFFSRDEIINVPNITKSTSDISNEHHIESIILGCVVLKDINETFLVDFNIILKNKEIEKITDNHQQFYKNHQYSIEKKKFNREVYISFFLDQLYALPIKDIQEIINFKNDLISPPEKNPIIKGMLNLRGNLVTIIDTCTLYQLNSNSLDQKNKKILILKQNNEYCGLVVDNIDSIVTINSDDKMKLPAIMTQKLKEKFTDDIKEVISIEDNSKNKKALIILNILPILNRIKENTAA